jgi:hypothetical protein
MCGWDGDIPNRYDLGCPRVLIEAGQPNNARPQRFAIHGEYAVVGERLGSNNIA